jgi:hypothetical protein
VIEENQEESIAIGCCHGIACELWGGIRAKPTIAGQGERIDWIPATPNKSAIATFTDTPGVPFRKPRIEEDGSEMDSAGVHLPC